MKLRLAQVKVYPEKGDLKENCKRLLQVLDSLGPEPPDVVVTPECFLDGYVSTEAYVTRENIVDYAVAPAASEYVRQVAAWAAASRTWCVLGCTRRVGVGAANTALLLDRAGTIVGSYDKTHCQTHDHKYVEGDALPVFQTDFGTLGIMICADRRWPETVRTLALKGARIILNPTYGMHDEANLRMMRTRSYESEVFIAFTHPAQALVTGPSGQVLTNDTDDGNCFTTTEVDLGMVDSIRDRKHSHLKDRRPDLYLS